MAIVVADTNAAYKLFFFADKNIIPSQKININGQGEVIFHPIVKTELDSHLVAYATLKELGYKPSNMNIPAFIKNAPDQYFLDRLDKFITDNLCSELKTFDLNDSKFSKHHQVYENLRKKIQKVLHKSDYKGNAKTSQPSIEDYNVLYAADIHDYKIVTNDGILKKVAEAYLDDDKVLIAEDLIRAVYKNDQSKQNDIDRAIDNATILGESILASRIRS